VVYTAEPTGGEGI